MDRIAGIETEYGCLVRGDAVHPNGDAWPVRVKNHLFRRLRAGAIDLHYRDYEEPPGNGGFLLNGGRIYLDMGHLEYASPECRQLRDIVAYDLAGDQLLQGALDSLGTADSVSFIKNNIDHHTGATFGCHENYLMKREAQFTPPALGALLAFLATRQISPAPAGSGRPILSRSISKFRPRKRRSISSSASGPTTSSMTFTNGCNSTAQSSTRATSRWPITGNIAGSICSSATRI
jgi:hypothetical protein